MKVEILRYNAYINKKKNVITMFTQIIQNIKK